MSKREAFATLFASWPRREDEPPLQNLLKAFETSCLYCEPWAVERAVNKFVQGKVENHNMAFRPTAPQIAQVAQGYQSEENRIKEISNRVEAQHNQIEYKGPPKEIRDAQVQLWQRIKAELSKPDITELAQEYMRRGWSTPRTIFDVHGAHFPDGTHHSIEEMRERINE